jgi:hypothetical protein
MCSDSGFAVLGIEALNSWMQLLLGAVAVRAQQQQQQQQQQQHADVMPSRDARLTCSQQEAAGSVVAALFFVWSGALKPHSRGPSSGASAGGEPDSTSCWS